MSETTSIRRIDRICSKTERIQLQYYFINYLYYIVIKKQIDKLYSTSRY